MKAGLLSLILISTIACKTTESSAAKAEKGIAVESESLIKWQIGRWSINPDGTETQKNKGTVVCEIKTTDVKTKLTPAQLTALQTAIKTLYPYRSSRQTSPIFRGLDQSRELTATFEGEEFLIEKMFQTRDAITPGAIAVNDASASSIATATASFEALMEIATNKKLCPKIPN